MSDKQNIPSNRAKPGVQPGPRSGEKPTLKTLSRLSGLAVPTVSRALSDAPDISETTKQKIRKIADEVGYIPNRAGVRLRTGKTNVIALILGSGEGIVNPTVRLILAITEQLRSTPYHLIVMPRLPDEDPMRSVRYVVETGSADGIILNQTEVRDPRVTYLLEKRFPFATHGRTEWMEQHPFFDYKNEEFAAQAVRHLFARGRKCVYVILPPISHSYSQHLRAGAIQAAHEVDVEVLFNDGATSDSSIGEIRDDIAKMLRQYPTIDAVICASPTSAMAAVSSIEATGRVVGRDIDVIGKETTGFLKEFRNAIISAPENFHKAGGFLAQAVQQAINDPQKPPLQGLDIPGDKFD